ncbi:MAG: hypothetical protein HQ580_20170 [Planctomycetes bacterium]|nr:hypothetical protein [Planctomycetota bacterium]
MTQTPEDKLEIVKIALEEGRKGLGDQDATVASIRQRSVWIGGLAGLVATFLGKEAIKVAPINQLAFSVDGISVWVGFVALIITIGLVIDILRPRGEFRFHNSPGKILDQFLNGPHATNLIKTYEELARFAEQNYQNNQALIDKLFIRLFFSGIAMIVEFIAWLIVLA